MNLDANAVVNLPGLDDREMDRLIALRAARQVSGPIAEYGDVEPFVHEFRGWLRESSGENDKVYRRYVLLIATWERQGVADRDAAKLRKLVDDVYRKI